MLSCFQFHLYAGVRAGGGIGDELDPPGDEDFYWRFAFDITFFFFIIVIMLAIIQVKNPVTSMLVTDVGDQMCW